MCEMFSNVFQAEMHLMSECWRHAWSSRLPKNPKIQKSILSNRIFGFRSKRWIFGFPKVFLDFFGFFERVFGFLGFQVKNPKKLKEKDGFLQKSNFYLHFLDVLEKSIFFLEFFWILISGLEKSIFFLGIFWIFAKIYLFPRFFWIFDIRIGKIHLFPTCFWDFCKNPSFSLGFFTFFEKSIFFLEFFWIFDLAIQTPFRRIQKNPKKPWEIQKSIFLTWIQRFCLKRWIFGFLVEQSSEIQDFIFWTWIQVF